MFWRNFALLYFTKLLQFTVYWENQAQIITPPPPSLTVDRGVVCGDILCLIFAKHLHTGRFTTKDIVPGELWFVQMQFCEPKSCCKILFGKKRPFLSILLWKPYLFSLFPILLSWTCTCYNCLLKRSILVK